MEIIIALAAIVLVLLARALIMNRRGRAGVARLEADDLRMCDRNPRQTPLKPPKRTRQPLSDRAVVKSPYGKAYGGRKGSPAKVPSRPSTARMREILGQVERNEITAEEAATLLREDL